MEKMIPNADRNAGSAGDDSSSSDGAALSPSCNRLTLVGPAVKID
jgi:hypothetical protein